MRMAVVVAVTGGGVVRGFVMRMSIVVVVAVLLIVGFGTMVVAIAIGVRWQFAIVAHGLGILVIGAGFGGLAAGEEQGGEGKRCEYAFHWILGLP
jgi:hypothetical protein